ncbi:M4 family metallopeptidase [Kaistella palustris]|uniref:M4 family metallopeptidase n=1 Tax=Kaistella palustris TaxID=493376 RepID=UPI000407071F|nr:M4 family metallopeptidase [Kaistella palustris]
MKRQLLTLGILGMVLGLNGTLAAQDVQNKVYNENGSVSLVEFKDGSTRNAASVSNLFKEILKLTAGQELRLVKTENDFSGKFVDEKYQLYFRNIKVEGGVYNVHYKNGNLISMNGAVFQDDSAAAVPAISSSAAFDAAVKSVNAQKYMWEDAGYIAENTYRKPTGELLYFPILQADGKYSLKLTYRFDIYAAQPLSRDYIYVDAVSGRIAAVDPIMKHAEKEGTSTETNFVTLPSPGILQAESLAKAVGVADTRYSGPQNIETSLSGGKYILHDTTRGNGVRTFNLRKSSSLSSAVEFQDDDNAWTTAEFDNGAFDNAALDAHWGVEKTYDYFKATFNRNSFDNNGTLLKSYVHYGNNYENAGWTGSEMIYGDGASRFKPLTAFDVTAHELGHGVCSSTANLVYQRESGALNEALSDIWGAAVEYTYAPNKETWLIGEDITKVNPGFLRSMSNPKAGNPPQPDTYRGINWYPSSIEDGCSSPGQTNDNCGVHYNSGVINHWFYILSVGKTGVNDNGSSYSVAGISIEKAAKIAYRLETNYLTSTSGFMDARNFGIKAAKDLYGADTPEAIATQDAFYAVGIGPKYLSVPDVIAPTAPADLSYKNTTGTQTVLEWTASTDENGVDKYFIYKNGVQTATVAGSKTTYTASGLTPNTAYSFYVKAQDPYENVSAASNTVTVTTLNTPVYCGISSSSTSDERIKRVQFGTIDNPSTSLAGYEDFSYLSTDVKKTLIYPITITPEWGGTVYSEGYAVFIDWNNDGDFTDANETALTIPASKGNPVTGNITVPGDITTTGPVRMRIIMKYNSTPTTACGNISYGQIEDYTLNLQNNLGVSNTSALSTMIYPNPVKDVISIQSKNAGEYTYKIFNVAGQLMSAGSSADKKISAAKLTVGNYMLELTDKQGVKTVTKFIKK